MRRRHHPSWLKPLAWSLLGLLATTIVVGALVWPRQRVVRGVSYYGVIFERRQTAELLANMMRGESAGYWTPSPADVRAMEAPLTAHVARERPDLAPYLSEYWRQYYGISRRGERRIYVVAFCPTEAFDWRREFASLADTSACHLEAEYDLATRRITLFWTGE
jgi:hypothetical protein